MHPHPPDIDCILIGVNCSKTLAACIESIQAADYPAEKLRICYVDGGSTDDSLEVARRYGEVQTLAITPEFPSPGLGRNTGWKHGSAPLVHFFDSDTVIEPQWFRQALKAIDEDGVGAVAGLRREKHPEHSVYNWIGNLEWNGPAGESDCFGGDVLIRREALEATGGYDEELVGGEDPELSRRITRAGWKIMRLDEPMTRHDLAMTTVSQYLRRAYRSGYGFGAVRHREALAGSAFWQYEYRKITIKGGGFTAALILSMPALAINSPIAGALTALLLLAGSTLLFMPRILRVGQFMREHKLDRKEARRYAWHCSLVVLPQLAGVLRFHLGRISAKPLRNKQKRLATALSDQLS
ncbi:glycosyltransferase [Chlorobium sp. N1]|uniref:glycosyltransferase n=1 Tax=Chlorobium sp. N1 TaxID=2491138 RepID=UPI001038CCEF|nr:glycosyltransferase [Chlorobium sp. N1]TCD48551.1 glycosyltransferase [Chlorobium sp. N1]